METFELTCSRTYAIVLILVALPLLMIFPIVWIMLNFRELPEWSVYVILFAAMGLMIFTTLYCIKHFASPPCTVNIGEEGIKIELKKSSLFFSGRVFSSAWGDLKAVSSNYEPQKGRRFYKIEFSRPEVSIYLNTPEENLLPGVETPFGALLMGYVEAINTRSSSSSSPVIETKGFYEAGWAKALTYFMWIVLAAFIPLFIFYPDTIDSWRVWQFAAYAGIWQAAYYTNRRK